MYNDIGGNANMETNQYKIILLRISTIDNNLNLENKLIYDIGLRRI